MRRLNSINTRWQAWLDDTRLRLARPDALIQLAVLGLMTGLLAGGVIVLFRVFVEGTQDWMLPGDGAENFEALPGWARLLLPLGAAILLAVMFRWFAGGIVMLGVARVMERMAYHQGRCTPRAFLLQFFGAAIAIIGGHSVGREGPHIFLGASSGSLLGQAFALPNNVTRTLVACGTAAGIAASFNTPLAGVVFALEVVMMEYSVASFIPVILAAVSATTLSNQVFGDHPAFVVPSLHSASAVDLMLVLAISLLAGACAAAFVHSVQTVGRRSKALAAHWRMLLAGLFMGLIATLLPQIMGIGYDTVGLALNGVVGIGLLLVLLIGKMLATSLCIGLGIPGGMIGPVLFMGAMLGALVAEIASRLAFDVANPVGFFALVGMGAMMSASLQAPLAALTAMLELTDQPEVILPGMFAVVIAGITAKEVFGKESLFVSMLRANGLDYAASPVHQTLRRIGVASIMERSLVRVERQLDRASAREVLADNPVYLLIETADGHLAMPAADLARYLAAADAGELEAGIEDPQHQDVLDLLAIPAHRLQLETVEVQANLQQAWTQLENSAAEALVVHRMTAPGIYRHYGILTHDMLEKSYRP